MNLFVKSFKALRDLGPKKLRYYFVYQLGLRSGHYQRVTPSRRSNYEGQPTSLPIQGYPIVVQSAKEQALREADEIRSGFVRLFGGKPVLLDLSLGASESHWTSLVTLTPEEDIKFIWEPARFGWAVTLARAFAFSQDPVYAQDFWDKCLFFLNAHPPNLGRQWQSAQEVAIRLMVLIFCDRVFEGAPSSTIDHRRRLWEAIAEHAERIPPTLIYARAQNNNHLLSETAGLFAASIYLADHPRAQEWRRLGWHGLNWGFQHQIDSFGTYVQNSTNYHRLMLQLAVYTDQLCRLTGDFTWPKETLARLQVATRWLWALTDPDTGAVPNLGANDSAYLFPLTSAPQQDYRPVIEAAANTFLKVDIYPNEAPSEMTQWFGLKPQPYSDQAQPQAMDMLRIDGGYGCAFIHAAHYTDRPSHADQLHVDLWWRGVNVALDPGTYHYNAMKPWDNALATARVHNTLTLDGHDQMTRIGRFLWLDWAQAAILSHEVDDLGNLVGITAEHNGYQRFGAMHNRKLNSIKNGWQVSDEVIPQGIQNHTDHVVHLTWILPDWEWLFVAENVLRLNGSEFTYEIELDGVDEIQLFRAGECIHGDRKAEPTWGWSSVTYGVKTPALMLLAIRQGKLPMALQSTFKFGV